MADIYGNDVQHGTTALVKASDMLMTIDGGGTLDGALAQQVNISYAQPVQIIREIGSVKFYTFAQPPQGQMNIGRLIATNKTVLQVFGKKLFGKPVGVTIIMQNISKDAVKLKYKMFNCAAVNLGTSVPAEGMCQEQISIMFTGLEIEEKI